MDAIIEKQNTKISGDMSTLNNNRMKYFSIVILVLVLFLFFVDNNNRTTGLWHSNYAYILLFYVHIAYFLLAIFGITISYITKTQKDIYPLIFIFFTLNISAICSGWVDQYIHGALSVYIMSCFCMSILFTMRPRYSIILYLQSYLVLVGCLYLNLPNLNIFQGNIGNASLVLPLVLFISVMLFKYTENEYFYKYNLEYLVKERTRELLEANKSLELAICEIERISTDKVDQLKSGLMLESELSQSNQLIADIIKDMPDCFYALDKQWRFMFVNKKAEELLLKTSDELLGRVFWDILPQAEGTLLELNCQKATKECIPITFDFLSSLKADTWFQITVFPCQFGLSIYFKDITEQRLSRKKLKKSQEETVSILESMTDGFLAINREGEFTNINHAGEKVLGKSRADLLGKKFTAETNKITSLYFREVMIEKKTINFEDNIGNKRLEYSVYPTENGLTCFFRDITSRKKAENEIARLDRLNLVGQLASGIAHEIRNPMSTVRGYLQLLGEKPAYEGRKSTFNLMISELDRANAIITEILSLAQTKQPELRSQSLNDILNSLYPILKADAVTQNKQISFIQGDIPNLKLNEKEISQMFLNIVRNGLESMEEKGSLTILSYVEDNRVVLAIEDEGCGILPENIKKLGTPFYTTKDFGIGLGLATSYRIAESHNAKIHFKSSSNGTTFFIHFPIPEKEKEHDGMIA